MSSRSCVGVRAPDSRGRSGVVAAACPVGFAMTSHESELFRRAFGGGKIRPFVRRERPVAARVFPTIAPAPGKWQQRMSAHARPGVGQSTGHWMPVRRQSSREFLIRRLAIGTGAAGPVCPIVVHTVLTPSVRISRCAIRETRAAVRCEAPGIIARSRTPRQHVRDHDRSQNHAGEYTAPGPGCRHPS